MSRGARRALLVLGVAGTAMLPACSTDVTFHVDDRVRIVSPQEREKVRLPVTVDWTVEDFDVARDGRFVVFVDQSPPPPGEHLRWVFRKDRSCRAADGCPDDTLLETNFIYPTTETQVTLETLPDFSDRPGKEYHEVTVVLVDPSGRRIGESAFFIRFELDRGK